MNSIRKNIQKTSGIHKEYKPGQLLTICKNVFRIVTSAIYIYLDKKNGVSIVLITYTIVILN